MRKRGAVRAIVPHRPDYMKDLNAWLAMCVMKFRFCHLTLTFTILPVATTALGLYNKTGSLSALIISSTYHHSIYHTMKQS